MKRILIFTLLLAIPLFAEAAGAPRTFKELAAQVVKLLSYSVQTLVFVGLVIYLWGIASNMLKLGEGQDPKAWRDFILWGIIILFVMTSVWGILRLMEASLFQSSGAGASTSLNDIKYLERTYAA